MPLPVKGEIDTASTVTAVPVISVPISSIPDFTIELILKNSTKNRMPNMVKMLPAMMKNFFMGLYYLGQRFVMLKYTKLMGDMFL